MQNCKINSAGSLEITPSKESSKHDFDFYEGKWNINNRKLEYEVKQMHRVDRI